MHKPANSTTKSRLFKAYNNKKRLKVSFLYQNDYI
jgi:hypothetical protein